MTVLRPFARRIKAGRLRAIALIALLGLAPASNCAAASTDVVFSNTTLIIINDPDEGVATASPYPSVIHVSGITANTITKAQVVLNDFSHTFPDDVDILLVAPDGRRSIVMSDAGLSTPVSHAYLAFSATGSAPVPDSTAINDGTPMRPANYDSPPDTFPEPGPGTLSREPADFDVFNGVDPNGDWSLYVVDDSSGNSGSILGGWTLVLTVPTVYTVTTTADTNDGTCDAHCSLREAIAAAGEGDLIRFASPLFDSSQTITLGGTELSIAKSLTIEGTGADRLSISGNHASGVFNAASGHAVTLKAMTIRDGSAAIGAGILSSAQLTLEHVALTGNRTNGSGLGGAIYQTGNGNFSGCTFSDNQGVTGGAIFFANPAQILRLANTTISGNRALVGGAVAVSSGSGEDTRLDVIDSTLADNAATVLGGGIEVTTQGIEGSTASVTLRNSIIANNAPSNFSVNVFTGPISIESQGFNLTNDASSPYLVSSADILGVDPKLGPLTNNGGQVETRALLGGSPALDAGDSSGYPADQRGQSRSFSALGALSPPGDYSDIGAAEMHAIFISSTADDGAGSLRLAMGIANIDGAGQDDILFDPNVFGTTPQTINLAGALPDIATNLSVNGPGAKLLTVRRDTGGDYRVFNVGTGYETAFSGLTISNGNVADSGGGGMQSFSRLSLAEVAISGNTAIGSTGGGGLAVYYADSVVKGSTFSGNHAGFGGAIQYDGSNSILRIIDSTLTANDASVEGPAILGVDADGTTTQVDLVNSTVAGNTGNFGGAILAITQGNANSRLVTSARNSILANNTLPNLGAANFDGGSTSIVSLGYNLADDDGSGYLIQPTDKTDTDPLLGSLAYNGGPTQTLALLAASPAIDGGAFSGSTSDQRGLDRPIDFVGTANASGGDGSDIGAFEFQDELFKSGFED